MAKILTIDTSNILGKLHEAACEHARKKFETISGVGKDKFAAIWRKYLTKAIIVIDNTNYDPKTKKFDIDKKSGSIVIYVSGRGIFGLNAEEKRKERAKEVAAEYMKWFAGIENFDMTPYSGPGLPLKMKDEEYKTNREDVKHGVSKFEIQYTLESSGNITVDREKEIDDEIKKALKDEKDNSKEEEVKDNSKEKETKSNNSNSNNEEYAFESIKSKNSSKKENLWESQHPFKILFEKKNMITEKEKSQKLVKQIVSEDNVGAQKTLESIIKDKIDKRLDKFLKNE